MGKREGLGKVFHQSPVGLVLHGRRSDPDFQGISVETLHLMFPRIGNRENREEPTPGPILRENPGGGFALWGPVHRAGARGSAATERAMRALRAEGVQGRGGAAGRTGAGPGAGVEGVGLSCPRRGPISMIRARPILLGMDSGLAKGSASLMTRFKTSKPSS